MTRIAYFLFLLLFFRYAQADVVNYIESMMLGRPAPYFPWLSALVLTALLLGVHCLMERFYSKRLRQGRAPYFDTAFLALLCVNVPFGWGWYMTGMLVAERLLILLSRLWRRHCLRLPDTVSRRWRKFATAIVPLILMCLYLGVGARATDTDHFEMRTAQALRTGRADEAYRVGERSLEGTPRLFAMRVYLMAKTERSGLGGTFLSQPVPPSDGSRNLLFPDDRRQRLLLSPDSLYALLGSRPRTGETPVEYFGRCARPVRTPDGRYRYRRAAAEYYMCALLLDGRLKDFARAVRLYRPRETASGRLPRYYAQAMLIYARSCPNPSEVYHDPAAEANYRDYTEMGDTIRPGARRVNLLRRSYGETYWWWYEYGMAERHTAGR